MTRLKVLHVIPSMESQSGGPVRALWNYVKCTKEAVESEIATTGWRLDPRELIQFQKSTPGVAFNIFPVWGRDHFKFSWSFSEWLRKNISSFDLIHLHALFSPTTSVAALWARQKGVPYVIRPLGTLSPYTFFSRNAFFKRVYFSMLEKRVLSGAGAIHFTSRLEMEKAMGFFRHQTPVVIPIPVEAGEEPLPAGPSEGRKTNLLFLSRIHPKKGLDLALSAFADLAPRYPEVDLLIAGTGELGYQRQIERLIREKGLENRVRFLGFLQGEDKVRVLKESRIFILPSRDENFGLAAAEALASGVPVVVSREVGIASDIEAYRSGIVVRCEVKSLREALEELIRDPKLCSEMGERGRRLVQERYHPKNIGDALFELYSVVHRNGSS